MAVIVVPAGRLRISATHPQAFFKSFHDKDGSNDSGWRLSTSFLAQQGKVSDHQLDLVVKSFFALPLNETKFALVMASKATTLSIAKAPIEQHKLI
jgi:hypothetical protein